MDALGGSSLRRSYGMLRAGGRLVAFGASSVTGAERRDPRKLVREGLPMIRGFNLVDQMSASKAVIGLHVLRLWDYRGTARSRGSPLTDLLADGGDDPAGRAEEVRRAARRLATACSPSVATSARSGADA